MWARLQRGAAYKKGRAVGRAGLQGGRGFKEGGVTRKAVCGPAKRSRVTCCPFSLRTESQTSPTPDLD